MGTRATTTILDGTTPLVTIYRQMDGGPSPVRAREIGMAKAALRKAGIRHRTAWARTSNCFSVGQHVLVAPQDRQRALEALRPLVDETRLLWVDGE